jgi:two-component system KDP operon response regulator KdpE
VLVVDDDLSVVELLTGRGFAAFASSGRERAARQVESARPDVVLLDLMRPEDDGFELCRQIREQSRVAIIVVSARGSEQDKATALRMGADHYITKPFGIEELIARILATLRHTRPVRAMAEPGLQVTTIGDVRIDLACQRVWLMDKQVHLTPTEFALLRELAINRGKPLSRAHLLHRVWGQAYTAESEYLRIYVSRLRAKLKAPGAPPLIITQPRSGYRIAAD